ncbi:MAG: EamA family transporter [Geodermatophilaceae bacterium]|nr:EamA family transporter [Geodermatophilaceae bacterium]MDQ3465681.1 DMT family transporter [Actinomycetota bacterium]
MVQRFAGSAGLGFAVLSAATFGTSGAFAASLLEAGWTPGAAVTVRVVLAALVLTVPALLMLRGRLGQLHRGAGTVAVYGIVAVAGAQLCYFNAVQHLSVAVALLLEYSGALLVVGWLWLRHGHRPRRLTMGGAAVAVLGLTLVLDLLGNTDLDPVGVLWGLGAAVGLATYFVLSAGTDDALPPIVVAWGGLAVGGAVLAAAGALGALPLAAPRTDVTLLDTEVSWLVPALGLSLIAAVVAYVAGIFGARLLGAKVASFVGLTEVLFAVLFAWLLLGQVLRPVQLAGGVLVVAGIALVRLDELRTPPPAIAPVATPHQDVLAAEPFRG